MVITNQITKIAIAIALSQFLISNNFAQQEKLSHFDFSFSYLNYTPLKIKNYGLPILESNITPSYEAGFHFNRTIKKGYGFGFGTTISAMSHNINMNFIIESNVFTDIESNFISNFKNYDNYRFSFPVYTFKQFKLKKEIYLKTTIGMNFDLMRNLPYTSETFISIGTNGFQNEEPLFYSMLRNDYSYLFYSYFVKIGFSKYFKKNDYLNINFVACHSPMTLGIGNYEFYNLNDVSKGFLEWKASYFGLEFNYGLKLKRKKDQDLK